MLGADGQVTALWGTTQDVTARREAEAAVRHLSMTDALTEPAEPRAGAGAAGHGAVGGGAQRLDRPAGARRRPLRRRERPPRAERGRRACWSRSAAGWPRSRTSLRTAGRLSADEFAVLVEHTTPAEALEPGAPAAPRPLAAVPAAGRGRAADDRRQRRRRAAPQRRADVGR
nr:hypothetical protein [Angustibacter aerolatus]